AGRHLRGRRRLRRPGSGCSSGGWSRLGTSRDAPGLGPVGASVLPRPLRLLIKRLTARVHLDPLLDRWTDDPGFADLLAALAADGGGPRAGGSVPRGARAFLLAGRARAAGRLVVVTTATTADAEALAADAAAFL